MPEQIITTVYAFAELNEAAQAKAVEQIRKKLDQDWWDSGDNDQVEESIRYTLAEQLHGPDSAFPGVQHLVMVGWTLERSGSVAVSAELTRDNAQALPWVDGIEKVTLTGHHRSSSTYLEVVNEVVDCSCAFLLHQPHEDGCPALTAPQVTDVHERAMEIAVREALDQAWSAGQKQVEMMTSEQRAREVIDDNGYRFLEDGTLHG